jgi:dTDP-4-dehydrorhamnose 3,5-epimerase
MRFEPTEIPGLTIIIRQPASDERGSFARLFCHDEFAAHGLQTRFVQQSVSLTISAGTMRGMHFQREPYAETKFVTCIRGAVYDVVADLRPNSPSYRRWQAFRLSADENTSLLIPPGCAHGFQTMRDDCGLLYQMDTPYTPEAASGFRFDDPAFAIAWPMPIRVIAPKDLAWPLLESS